MVARFAGAGLGLLAFAITVFAGLFVQNPVAVTLSRSILALFVFCIFGFCLGTVAELVVREYEQGKQSEIRKRFRGDSAEPNDDGVEDGSREDSAVSKSA